MNKFLLTLFGFLDCKSLIQIILGIVITTATAVFSAFAYFKNTFYCLRNIREYNFNNVNGFTTLKV